MTEYSRANRESMLKESIPVNIGFTREGWFALFIPALLPKKSKGNANYYREALYLALDRFFAYKARVRYPKCVLVFRHVYDRSRPERQYRDHDNIEINAVADAVAFFTMKDDHPLCCKHYYCRAVGSADRDGQVYTSKLMTVSGKRANRTIRLHRGALPVLNAIHPNALEYYLNSFQNHRFTGDAFHIWRNHRVSESLAICLSAGIEIRPYTLPELQLDEFRRTVPGFPSFYIARDFKKLDVEEFNKTMYTRIVVAVFYPGGVYAVYNTRGAVMKWSGMRFDKIY